MLGAEPPSAVGRELTEEPPDDVERVLVCGADRGLVEEPPCAAGRGVPVGYSLREVRGCSPLFSVEC